MAQADLDAPLIVCCYHGNSSQGAANYFAEQGFKNACSLDGGFEQWKVMYPEACES
jgi:thiosulfate sulfurtransferase